MIKKKETNASMDASTNNPNAKTMEDSKQTEQGTSGEVTLTTPNVADVGRVVNQAVEQAMDEFCYFDNVRCNTPKIVSLHEVMRMIMEDSMVRKNTEMCRSAYAVGDAKSADSYKEMLPCFVPACVFEGGRRQEHIVRYTGLTYADFDHIPDDILAEVMEKLRTDEHTCMSHLTARGHGVHAMGWVVYEGTDEDLKRLHDDPKYMKEQYTRAFFIANEYFSKLLGLKYDPKCKDPGHMSIIAYDLNAHFNPNATPFVIKLEKKRKPGRPPKKPTAQEAESYVIEHLTELGEKFEKLNRNTYLYKAACDMNRHGVNEENCVEWAVGKYEADDFTREEIASTIRSAYGANEEEHGTKQLSKGVKNHNSHTASLEEIEQYLKEQDIRTRHNELSGKYEKYDEKEDKWREMEDCDEHDILILLSKTYGKRIQKSDLLDVLHSSYSPKYNPIVSYLESLEYVDDGIDYIEELANRVHVADGKQEMHNKHFKKWFLWMVAGWVKLGVTNHVTYVMVGEQGIFKSTYLRHLLPPHLRHMTCSFDVKGYMKTDDNLKLSSHLILELDEFDNLNRRELANFKSLVTRDQSNDRASYHRNSKNRRRIATFCASTNNPNFLNDPNGNRRCFPVKVDYIDSPFDNPINYDKLYAQAYHLVNSGFEYVFTYEDNKQLKEHIAEFVESSIEEELIKTYFRQPNNDERGQFFQTVDVMNFITSNNSGLRLSKYHVNASLKSLGFEKIKITTKSSPNYGKNGWLVIPFTPEQRKANREMVEEEPVENLQSDASECINLELPF